MWTKMSIVRPMELSTVSHESRKNFGKVDNKCTDTEKIWEQNVKICKP